MASTERVLAAHRSGLSMNFTVFWMMQHFDREHCEGDRGLVSGAQ